MGSQESSRQHEFLRSDLKGIIACMDVFQDLSRKKTGRGFVHPFISGLVFSSAIMEKVRGQLPQDVNISWGQILDENDALSGEIDMMTYERRPHHE